MDAQKTGKLIQVTRTEKGMTQKDLADKIHVSRAAVSKWERGLSFPDIAVLEDLVNVLGISITELMHGERDEKTVSSEKDLHDLSRTVKEQKKEQNKMKKALIAFICMLAAVFIAFLIWLGRRPVFSLIRHNSYEGIYNVSGSSFQLTFYNSVNGKVQASSGYGFDDQWIDHITMDKEYGIQIHGSRSPEFEYSIDTSDLVPLHFKDSLKAAHQEQILAIDADHDLNADIEELKNSDENVCFVTVRYTGNY